MRYVLLVGAIAVGVRQGFTVESTLLIAFVLWAIPLDYFRTKFRMIVYDTRDWKIALKPVFLKEIKALLGLEQVAHPKFSTYKKWYAFYIIVFILLFQLWRHAAFVETLLFS